MWLTCSGSLIPNILAGDSAGKEAAEGSVAHAVAELWLKTGKRPKHLIGEIREQDGYDIEITEEMLAYCGDYVEWCQELEDDAVWFQVETKVDISDLTPIPNQRGTSDLIALLPTKRHGEWKLYVRDLKYGKGVRVNAEENTQGMLYAYGSYKLLRHEFNIVEIEIGICHPRLKDGTTTYTITPEKLIEWTHWVKERAYAAWQFNAPRTPSDAGCQWCKVKATCPALYRRTQEVTSDAFADDDEFDDEELREAADEAADMLGDEPFRPHDPAKLSTEALARILRYRKTIEDFLGAVEAELLERAISREEDIPGWKIVEGRANRKWGDEVAVYRKLRAMGLRDGAIYDQAIISPAEAEKRLHSKAGLSKEAAAKIVNSVAVKPRGAKSLVRTSDKRNALPKDGDAFKDDDPFEDDIL